MFFNDAFPNAKQHFRDAFALSDPAPELLELIKAHPTFHAVINLLVQYIEVVQENPSRANALTLTLKTVRDSADAPAPDGYRLCELYGLELPDLYRPGFDAVDKNTKGFVPTNAFLLTSLLSGLSIRYELSDSSAQYGNIWEGLDADSPTSEVRVIGACIQLLVGGSKVVRISEGYIQSVKDVGTKLKIQKSRGTVKDPNALQLLELAIWHAKTGYKKKNDLKKKDLDTIWKLIFPSRDGRLSA